MRRTFPHLWLLGLLLACGSSWAQRVEGDRASAQGPYQAEVAVNGQGPAERNAGFARALTQVLAKLSGDRSAAGRPGVGQELRRARDYVDSYDYRQDEGISPTTGAPSFSTTLIVRFDQAKVDNIVAALGLPVWPLPRPKPVLWLAIDDGNGPRLVGLPKADAARAVLDRAKARGYALGLPNGTAAEQAAIGAIWRGDAAAIARLSARYSPPMQLIGKLYRDKGNWTGDWIFVDQGRVLSKWSSSDANARRAMAAGADGTADALMRKYARRGAGAGPAGTFRVAFTGIDSSEDLMRLSAYLQRMSVVRRITPVRATPEALVLDLELSTGLAGFRRLVDDDVLVAGEGDSPTFRLR
ncbi:MAG: DUF2066 domain-containing protein [Gammaproteobacteria bacterium]|nr:DUF2066 domain-containing protein [Gammaproteobacteria bacterium]